MEHNNEKQFLKELFESFGCKNADIKEIKTDDELPLMSFVVGDTYEGQSIDSPEWYPLFGADTPHFCILSKGIGYVRIDLCMEVSFVKEYLVGLYLKKEFLNTLGVYFNNGAVVNPQPVDFGVVLHFASCDLVVENMGSIEYCEITNRAVLNNNSNMPFPADLVEVGDIFLSNIIDLRMVSDDHETYADNFRFALSVDELEDFVAILGNAAKKGNYSFKFIVGKKECFDLDAVEAEFEHSKSHWKTVYEEGLAE